MTGEAYTLAADPFEQLSAVLAPLQRNSSEQRPSIHLASKERKRNNAIKRYFSLEALLIF